MNIRHSYLFFNDTATTEIYTLSLHDALPISWHFRTIQSRDATQPAGGRAVSKRTTAPDASRQSALAERRNVAGRRSEEHTSELQSRQYLVCRLLLDKKKHDKLHGSE